MVLALVVLAVVVMEFGVLEAAVQVDAGGFGRIDQPFCQVCCSRASKVLVAVMVFFFYSTSSLPLPSKPVCSCFAEVGWFGWDQQIGTLVDGCLHWPESCRLVM